MGKAKKVFKKAKRVVKNPANLLNTATLGLTDLAKEAKKALKPKTPGAGDLGTQETELSAPVDAVKTQLEDAKSEGPSQSQLLQNLRRRAKRRRQGVVANASGLVGNAGVQRGLVGL